jgi:serine/threonine protein kinase
MAPDPASVPDPDLEAGIQALLDDQPLRLSETRAPDDHRGELLRVVDVIGRAARIVLFGRERPLEAAPARWGHLELRGEIGRGASGTVYRAWDPQLRREVALKLFPSDLDARDALQEGQLLARLNHPHIVKVFGAGVHDGSAGIWMELLDGETLEDVLARDGVFGPEETLLIGLDLAGALSAIHAAGLLHRDIKARNVVRERGGRIVLADLGAGRVDQPTSHHGFETGTPVYMAPEVLDGAAATARSDIYSLGVLMFRLLTAAVPVSAGSIDALRAAHAAGKRERLADQRSALSAEIVHVVERACDARPDLRTASAPELEDALAAALQRRLSAGAPLTIWQRRWMRWRGPTLIIASTVGIALVLLTTLWDSTWGRSARWGVGLSVPPRSTLYITTIGGVAVLRGHDLGLLSTNPGSAFTMAVSSDLGIRTKASLPPWTTGGAFRLDGTPVGTIPAAQDICCWTDGTTDGRFNYAIRQDSTLLEPIGSRPLARSAVYRFDRAWSNPVSLFPLEPSGTYTGITYSARWNAFLATRLEGDDSLIECWNIDGARLATPVRFPGAIFRGIAADPADATLWVVRKESGRARLENFDLSGRHLSTVEIPTVDPSLPVTGAEFAWTGQ